MNRVQGDYFETLLYKIFVSIDEYTDMKELSTVLQIDLEQVKVGHVISWRRSRLMSFDVIIVRMQCPCSFVLVLLTRRPHLWTPPTSMHRGAELLHHH